MIPVRCKLSFMDTSADAAEKDSCTGRLLNRRTLARAAGNLLIGASLGLLAYYGITDFATRIEQRNLRAEFSPAPAPDPVNAGEDQEEDRPVMDFADWDDSDVPYWQGQSEGQPFGRLVIEAIGIDQIIVRGHERDSLRRGPGWIDYTDLPGPTGNSGIAGHRTTHGAPFRRIDELRAGDLIELYSPYRVYVYEVAESFRVTPDRVDVMRTSEKPRLTLSACDPPFSARYRLIVQADLVSVTRLQQ